MWRDKNKIDDKSIIGKFREAYLTYILSWLRQEKTKHHVFREYVGPIFRVIVCYHKGVLCYGCEMVR